MHCIMGQEMTGIDDENIVPYWSFSKTILAMAVLKLVELNKLDLSKKYYNMEATLKQLLRHEAGYSDYSASKKYHTAVNNNDLPWTFDEMITTTGTKDLIYKPGTGWQYSNIAYYYVRRLIEDTTALSLEDALNELLFKALCLEDIKLAETSSDLENVLHVKKGYRPKWLYHGMLTGSLRSAVVLLHNLSRGQIINGNLLNEMKETFELNFDMGDRPWKKPGYALGLMVDNQKGCGFSYGHTGRGPGSVICVYHYDFPSCTVAVSMKTADQGLVEYEVVGLRNTL